MSAEIARRDAVIEEAMVQGNLANLTPAERVCYYKRVCESLGLNPLTKPFDYITLNGKLTLYARKDAADQLRSTRGVSIDKPVIQFEDEWIIVTVTARLPDGRTDSDIGCVSRKDMRGDFGNALMKAITKAKRRVTLSICGLGMLDETEVETIPNAIPRPVQQLPELPPPSAEHQASILESIETGIRECEDLTELRSIWVRACAHADQGDITREQIRDLAKLKDGRKAEIQAETEPQPEGEYAGDHTLGVAG